MVVVFCDDGLSKPDHHSRIKTFLVSSSLYPLAFGSIISNLKICEMLTLIRLCARIGVGLRPGVFRPTIFLLPAKSVHLLLHHPLFCTTYNRNSQKYEQDGLVGYHDAESSYPLVIGARLWPPWGTSFGPPRL